MSKPVGEFDRGELERAGEFLADFDEMTSGSVEYQFAVTRLRALAGKLLGDLSALNEGEGLTREYATYSPNGKAHTKLNIHNHGDEAYDIRFAHEFAEIYLEQSLDGGVHGDPDAAAVYRFVGPWEYMEGYPKTPEQVREMVEEKKIHGAP